MALPPICARLLAVLALAAAAARADCNARRRGAPLADVPPQLPGARPVIGVLSVPLSGGDAARCETAAAAAAARPGARAPALNAQCFSAFYFRWLEAAGARALILPYDAEPALLAQLLDGVNGALLTGGELDAAGLAFGAPYMLAAKQVLDTARRKVDAGVFFPVHGTCQGMQVISLLASGNASIMSYNAFDAENISLPLEISWDGHHASRIFSANSAPADVVGTLMGENVTLNLHHDGVTPDAFTADANLSRDYVLCSINADRRGNYFCSTLEACDYPITATQWHPERPAMEWIEVRGGRGAGRRVRE
jgi:gamma-glutamyl hydrolase